MCFALIHLFPASTQNPSSDSIWSTAWVSFLPSYRPSRRCPNSRYLPPLSIVDLIIPGTRRWNEHLLFALFDPASAIAVSRLPISLVPTTSYLWTPSCSGRFSTSSAYLSISHNDFTGSSPPSPFSIWKDIWKLQLMDRLRMFLWKIACDILPTTLRLQSILPTYILDISCPLCKSGSDSLMHLFFHCHFARVAWRLSRWPLDSTTLDSPNLCDWIRAILYLEPILYIPCSKLHCFQVFATVTCDLLWFHRNKAFHDGLSFDACILAKLIINNYHQHCDAWSNKFRSHFGEVDPSSTKLVQDQFCYCYSRLLLLSSGYLSRS
jgi:hypothetical protein